jgi:hypothetical protein
MPKLTDPDSLSVAVNAAATTQEVEIQTGPLTIELRVSGNLDDTSPGKTSGVTGRCIYSLFKEEWLTNAVLRRHRFPLQMIFEGSFIWVNGWAPANQQTRDLIRDAGFQEQVAGTDNTCLVSLGAINAPGSDLAYYTQVRSPTAPPTNFDKTGELNENVDVTGATTYLKIFIREQGKVYSEYDLLTELGISAVTYQAYSFPLSNSIDSRIAESDGNIDTLAPYTGMQINYIKGVGFTTWTIATAYVAQSVVQDQFGRWWFTVAGGTSAVDDSDLGGGSDTGVTWVPYFGEELIGSVYYAFNREVDANGGSAQQAHAFMSRQLRQAGDINDDTGITVGQDSFGAVNGSVARLLSSYVGDNLFLRPGVLLRNFNADSTNIIRHQPITVDSGGLDPDGAPIESTVVSFPFVSAGSFVFSANIVAQPDAQTIYTVYFDYITTTTSTGIALTGASGVNATLSWAADAGVLDFLQSGDYVQISGFTTNPTNNGLYLLTGAPAANTVTVTKQDSVTVINETAGDSVNVLENPFASPGAVIVKNNAGVDMDGQVSASVIPFDFDFSNNVQGGRIPATEAPCTIISMALAGAQWVSASFTISAATGISVPVNPSNELNYANA